MPVERNNLAYDKPSNKAYAIINEKIIECDCNHIVFSFDVYNVSRSHTFVKKKNKLFLFAPVGRE